MRHILALVACSHNLGFIEEKCRDKADGKDLGAELSVGAEEALRSLSTISRVSAGSIKELCVY